MPYKPNGGKPGRPKKKLGELLSSKQMAFLEYLLKYPDHTKSWYARKVGVSRQTMDEWCKRDTLMMQEAGRSLTRNYQQIAKDLVLADTNSATFQSSNPQFTREANIRRRVNENWDGPMTLPGSTDVIETSEDFIVFMLKKGLTFYD